MIIPFKGNKKDDHNCYLLHRQYLFNRLAQDNKSVSKIVNESAPHKSIMWRQNRWIMWKNLRELEWYWNNLYGHRWWGL